MRNTVLWFGLLVAAASLATGQGYIGRLDTIGGTTYDWWANAGVHRWLVNSPAYGIHALWMYSSSTSGTDFPDRNTRYHFYDYTTRQWNWPDPGHMQSGVNVFGERTGYGVLDADTAGLASVAAHTGSRVVLARDAAPGAGVFDYCAGPSGFQWPDMAIGDNGTHHVAMYSPVYFLSYSRVRTWCNWDSARTLSSLAFPAYQLAASNTAPNVCVTWTADTRAYYVLSENRGDTWDSLKELDPPPAFGGDTATRFSLAGPFPFFDFQGGLHFAAAVFPEVHDTVYSNFAEIWHWSPDNQPNWARIHHAGYADRPSMGEGNDGRLFVAWEQFDSTNVETTTNRLRAGVWISGSANNGMTWVPGLLVTERNTFSHRFPCIIDRMVGSPTDDTICVLYLMDSIAGSCVQNEGPATPNPVVCQFIPSTYVGVAERPRPQASSFKAAATVVRGVLILAVGSRQNTEFRGELLDEAGRKVLDLHPGVNDVSRLAPGVYFVRAAAAEAQARAARKVVVTR